MYHFNSSAEKKDWEAFMEDERINDTVYKEELQEIEKMKGGKTNIHKKKRELLHRYRDKWKRKWDSRPSEPSHPRLQEKGIPEERYSEWIVWRARKMQHSDKYQRKVQQIYDTCEEGPERIKRREKLLKEASETWKPLFLKGDEATDPDIPKNNKSQATPATKQKEAMRAEDEDIFYKGPIYSLGEQIAWLSKHHIYAASFPPRAGGF